MKAFGVAAALLVGSCHAATQPAGPPPPRGPASWLELSSEHFTVWTDDTQDHGRALIRTMEHLRQIIYGVSFFHPTTTPAKCLVIALRDVDEVHEYVPEQFIAYAFSPRNVVMQPVIVLPIDHLENDPRIVIHELTHAISYSAIAEQPHWFAEGLATYFETIRLREGGSSVDVGAPIDFRIRELREHHPLPVASLFACDQPSCMDDRYYTSVWILFEFLMNQHPNELMRYMVALAETGAAAGSWTASVPALPAEQLDHELAAWIAHGKVLVRQYNLKLQDSAVTQRALGDGDAYAARALLLYLRDLQRAVPPEVEQALAIDPANVVANMIKAAHQRAVSADIAHLVEAAHPDDWRAWWLVARAEQRGPEALAARDKMCALVAKNPAILPRGMCATP